MMLGEPHPYTPRVTWGDCKLCGGRPDAPAHVQPEPPRPDYLTALRKAQGWT